MSSFVPGAVLADHDLRAGGFVVPFDPDRVQPCSIDVVCGGRVGIPGTPRTKDGMARGYIDPVHGIYPETTLRDISAETPFRLEPGAFVLAETAERIVVPDDCVAILWNRSSLARIGLLNNPMAGLADPGWNGVLTVELFNMARWPILLRPGMAIGQLIVLRLTSPAERPYGSAGLGSKYQHAQAVEGARA